MLGDIFFPEKSSFQIIFARRSLLHPRQTIPVEAGQLQNIVFLGSRRITSMPWKKKNMLFSDLFFTACYTWTKHKTSPGNICLIWDAVLCWWYFVLKGVSPRNCSFSFVFPLLLMSLYSIFLTTRPPAFDFVCFLRFKLHHKSIKQAVSGEIILTYNKIY